jgi:DNA-binding transcriptional ArsR family regulator
MRTSRSSRRQLGGFSIGHIVGSKADVDPLLQCSQAAGATDRFRQDGGQAARVPDLAAATSKRTARTLFPFPGRPAILNLMVQYPTTVDLAFAALADPNRRAVLERLGAGSATISELAEPFGMSLTGMRKHIRLLEEANIVATEKVGRARRCVLVPYAFEGISTWLQRLDRFAQVVERTKGAR